MPSDPRAGPVSCWKSTLRRRPLGPEFPISPAPLLDPDRLESVDSSIHRILDCSRGECKAMWRHPMLVLSDSLKMIIMFRIASAYRS